MAKAKATDLLADLAKSQPKSATVPIAPPVADEAPSTPGTRFPKAFTVRMTEAQYTALEKHLEGHGELVAAGARRILVEYLRNQGLL